MAKLLSCRPTAEFEVMLAFDDGICGKVYLGGLAGSGSFAPWRDRRVFMTARIDQDGMLSWPQAGITLDPVIFWEHLAPHLVARKRPRRQPPKKQDVGFQRFMAKVLKS